uniref:Delta(3,5)-Delta(2,4)-dienoyl-CoA isomerase, mitochondrial n=1 Tax=Elaeophora elaphi TaxID=1147741 RepID=A0A0R3RZ61_9BILA
MKKNFSILQHLQSLRNSKKFSLSTLSGLHFIEVTKHSQHVFNVKLNRPDTRNAFTLPFWRELQNVFDHLATNSKCRSIVLSAAGKSFCAGINLKDEFDQLSAVVRSGSLDVGRKSLKLHEMIATCQDSFTALEKCPKPVIAAIHGHCIGAGMSLVAAADIRYASSNTVFSIKEEAIKDELEEVDIGLAADVGVLNRINKLVGNDSLTREFAYTARDFHCSKALKYGFISRQFDSAEECLSAALSLADKIATKSPIAIQGTKLALNYSRDHPIDDSIQFIRIWNQSQLQSDDLFLASAAAFSKEKPKFNDA